MTYSINDSNIVFKYFSIKLKDIFMSNLNVSSVFTIELAKCIYLYLKEWFPQQEFVLEDGTTILSDDVSECFLKSCLIHPEIEDLGDTKNANKLYDRSRTIIPSSIDEINEFNLSIWEMSDYISQYLYIGTIVSPLSLIDDIARIQSLFEASGEYQVEKLGMFDSRLAFLCYNIQKDTKVNNSDIICTGYFDKCVEYHVRSKNEVR